MKTQPFIWLFFVTMLLGFASCASSPYKKRKRCSGKGGWYGDRNLSTQPEAQPIHRF